MSGPDTVTRVMFLDTVIGLIRTPGQWTKGVAARNINGRPVDQLDPNARQLCLSAATSRAAIHELPTKFTEPDHTMEIWDGFHALRHALLQNAVVGGDLCKFNDHPNTTHGDVIFVLESTRPALAAIDADRRRIWNEGLSAWATRSKLDPASEDPE